MFPTAVGMKRGVISTAIRIYIYIGYSWLVRCDIKDCVSKKEGLFASFS